MTPVGVEMEAGEQQGSGAPKEAGRELSLPAFAAIVVLSLLCCVAVVGLLVWLAVWLQPQLAAL
jgi:hypothetical protein